MLRTSIANISFVKHVRLRGLSSRTVEFYRYGLKHLENHCRDLPERQLTLLPVSENPRSNRESQHELKRVLPRFFRWAAREYAVPNPTVDMERVRSRKTLPRVLSHGEVAAMM